MNDYLTVTELARILIVRPMVIRKLANAAGLLQQNEKGEDVVSRKAFMASLPGITVEEAISAKANAGAGVQTPIQIRSSFHAKVTRALKKNLSCPECEAVLGYSMEDLKARLRATIPKGYDWQDFVEGRLHLDHVTPGYVFNIHDLDSLDFSRSWSLENLQLLPESDHRKKGKQFTPPFQPGLDLKERRTHEADRRTIF